MRRNESAKTTAWVIFDRIVANATAEGHHSNPWVKGESGARIYVPDYGTLGALLGVPLYLKAPTTSGVPALALDVWLSYELRRAGFDRDAIWPRAEHPRILPMPVVNLLRRLPRTMQKELQRHISGKESIPGVTSSSANILGKNYFKQVDVIMTGWDTGPELLISTKRMDSSYGKNAANRVEESYGDAKNLRLRHPLAALGFLFGVRSDILQKEPDTFEWLADLLGKLGREEDAYHATCLVLMDYDGVNALPESGEDGQGALLFEEPESGLATEDEAPPAPDFDLDEVIRNLPIVRILEAQTPKELSPGLFLASMVDRVLDATPVNMHRDARRRRDFRNE